MFGFYGMDNPENHKFVRKYFGWVDNPKMYWFCDNSFLYRKKLWLTYSFQPKKEGDSMTISTILKERMAALTYPANQSYNPENFEPLGVTRERIDLMEKGAPELLEGGDSLLDIGSSKGFMCFHLRNKFKSIDGFEISKEAFEMANEVRDAHGLAHITFHNDSFENIILGKRNNPNYCFKRYATVYAGSVHHHFFKNAVIRGIAQYLWAQKLKGLAEKYIILDGVFDFEGDCSLNTWAKEYGWGDEIKSIYSLSRHIDEMRQQFELAHIRGNERNRLTAVFKRVKPDIEYITMTKDDIEKLKKDGEIIAANKARPDGSVVKSGEWRYKFDPRGMQNDATLLVTNYLSNFFTHTKAVIVDESGNRIGDIAKWIEGEKGICSAETMWTHWLKMNRSLASVGLIEPH
jgi:hypothetical protein